MNFHSLGESKCSLLTLPVWDPASLRTRNTVVSTKHPQNTRQAPPLVRTVIQEYLEAEMAEAVGAEKGERVERRFVGANGDVRPGSIDSERQSHQRGALWTQF